MTSRLVIRLRNETAASWLWTGKDGVEHFGEIQGVGDISAALPEHPDRVVLVLPGCEVLSRRVEIPARTELQARAAVGYLLAETLADKTDKQHFALAGRNPDGRRGVAVIARQRLEVHLARLQNAGLDPDLVLPEYLLLDANDEQAVLRQDDERLIVALSAQEGFSLETGLALEILPETLERYGVDKLRIESGESKAPAPAGGWSSKLKVTHVPAGDEAALLRTMAARLDHAAVNLRQGSFAHRRGRAGATLNDLSGLAAMAGLLAVMAATWLFLDARHYAAMAERLDARTERLLRTTLPGVARIVNPAAQLAAARAQLEGGGAEGFLDLANKLVSGIASVDGVRLTSLRYADEQTVLRAEISYGNFGDLEPLKAAIAERGARLEETTARQENARIVSSITVEPAP